MYFKLDNYEDSKGSFNSKGLSFWDSNVLSSKQIDEDKFIKLSSDGVKATDQVVCQMSK